MSCSLVCAFFPASREFPPSVTKQKKKSQQYKGQKKSRSSAPSPCTLPLSLLPLCLHLLQCTLPFPSFFLYLRAKLHSPRLFTILTLRASLFTPKQSIETKSKLSYTGYIFVPV